MKVYIARQPILNKNLEVEAYELLYRSNSKNAFDPTTSAEDATKNLLINTYFDFGVNNLLSDKKGYINFNESLILEGLPELLNKEQVVIEVLESVDLNDVVIEKLLELKKKGYKIALDDYIHGSHPISKLEIFDVIKVDILNNSIEDIRRIARDLSHLDTTLLAEKIENNEIYEYTKSLGYELFQGYFFSKPKMLEEKSSRYISRQHIEVLREMNLEDPDYRKISNIIETEPSLAYNLLKLVNSNFTKSYYISSVHMALNMIGINKFRKWFTMSMIKNLGKDKPGELVRMGMVRAKFMELYAIEFEPKWDVEEATMIGVLSILDALLEREMKDIVKEMPLSSDVEATLLMEDSPYLEGYLTVINYEKSLVYPEEYGHNKYDYSKLSSLYYKALEWADTNYEEV